MNKSFLKKGFIASMLTGVLVLGACSSGDGNDEAADGQTVVDIFQFKVEFKDQFEQIVQDFEEENPDIKINVQTVGGGNDYGAALKSSFAAGNEPDIFNVGGPSDVDEYRDYLADLSDTEAASQALEGTLDGVEQQNGEILGLPYNQEGYGYIYNKEIFEQAGVDAESISTYEDLEEAFATIDSQKEELGIDAVIALPAKELWVMGNHLGNTFFASDFDNSIVEAYEADTIPLERSQELKRMLDLQNEYSVQPVLSLDYSQQVEQLFSTGRVAVIQQGNWVYPTIEQMDAEFAENNIGMIPIPVDGLEGHLPVGVPNYWGVNKQSDEEVQEAAKQFLDWMYTSDTGKDFVLNEFKFIPAYDGYDEEQIADPLSKEVYKYSQEGNTIGWVFLGTPNGWQEHVLGAEMQRYLSGDASWDEAMESAISQWESARK
ncbi:ABC transporter substrate-binding protein [Oceanobacillus sp. J11TS1]|nr:ABC transporter substrate-binding protein [Oceanobacillus sp. J11TS1]